MNFEWDFDTFERRVILHLATVFPSLSVRKYPSAFKEYALQNVHGELLVLLQRLDHPTPDSSCCDPDCPSAASATYPRMEVAIILAVKDDDTRSRVSRLLGELRKAMGVFLLPSPSYGNVAVPGTWSVDPLEEKFLVEEDSVWIYGTTYGIHFRPAFAIKVLPAFPNAHTSEGVPR